MISVLGWSIRPPTPLTRLVVLALFSALLMVLDHRGDHLARIRAGLSVATAPIYFLAELPVRLGSAISDFFTTSQTLREEIAVLKTGHEQAVTRLQQLEALEAENDRLRAMLGSAARVATRALAADLIEVSNEPFSRKIILARGSHHKVYVGQPVIDAYGVMGQVTQVAGEMARVTLITDPGHAIPVLVNRNGLRALVFGTGAADTLKVPYLTANADIKEGDLLISSGMGGTFPAGYPVAKVARIINDRNESFLDITAQPIARLNHGKQAMLIWPEAAAAKPADTGKPAAAPRGTPPK